MNNIPSPAFNQISPDQAVAICTRDQAMQLAGYDHYRVRILGKSGLLLISEWQPIEKHMGPFILTAVFHQVGEYPQVPESVQMVVNALKFKIRGQAR